MCSAREVHIYEPVITLDLRRRAEQRMNTAESGSFSVPWNNVGRGSSVARPSGVARLRSLGRANGRKRGELYRDPCNPFVQTGKNPSTISL